MPMLGDFLAAGASELRRGNEAIFPPLSAKMRDSKCPRVVLAFARR